MVGVACISFVFKFFTSSISNKGALAPDGLGPFFFFHVQRNYQRGQCFHALLIEAFPDLVYFFPRPRTSLLTCTSSTENTVFTLHVDSPFFVSFLFPFPCFVASSGPGRIRPIGWIKLIRRKRFPVWYKNEHASRRRWRLSKQSTARASCLHVPFFGSSIHPRSTSETPQRTACRSWD